MRSAIMDYLKRKDA